MAGKFVGIVRKNNLRDDKDVGRKERPDLINTSEVEAMRFALGCGYRGGCG